MLILCRLFGTLNVAAGCAIMTMLLFLPAGPPDAVVDPAVVIGGTEGPTAIYITSVLADTVVPWCLAALLVGSGLLLTMRNIFIEK